jgi:1,2-diacylglycerol 3-beta-galactosyltransferase
LEEYDPDVVISVHPTMNYIPERAIRNIAKKKGVYIPFFTVVTDFGSGHCTWFQGNPDMIYVASERIKKLAKRRGGHNDGKLVMSGLPIRDDFAVQAERMGDRTSVKGKSYRQLMKGQLGLSPNKKVVLLMGGGEGVGSLAMIAKKLREQLIRDGVDATICVICGRNEKLKNELNNQNWEQNDFSNDSTNDKAESKPKKKRRMRLLNFIGKVIPRKKQQQNSPSSTASTASTAIISTQVQGNVDIIGLGFITNMAEYMIAADVLVSKAGPGTIAEAAAVGLPVMITSFLPGQEAGNVDIVLDGKFGAFSKKPTKIASIVSSWLKEEEVLDEMSRRSSEVGNPTAAREIVQDIVRLSLEKMKHN